MKQEKITFHLLLNKIDLLTEWGILSSNLMWEFSNFLKLYIKCHVAYQLLMDYSMSKFDSFLNVWLQLWPNF